MNTVLRVVVRGRVRVGGVVWAAQALADHEGALIDVRLEAGTAVAVLDGTACPLMRLEG